jgi:hypothetical protein
MSISMSNAELSTAKEDYHIHLNFLPVDMSGLQFVIYRRKCAFAGTASDSASKRS